MRIGLRLIKWLNITNMVFGRTSDYVNEEIRIGRISREEGIKLVEKYDSIFGDKYVESFLWLYSNIKKKIFGLKYIKM